MSVPELNVKAQRALEHRAVAHRLRAEGADARSIADVLGVRPRTVWRYLQLPAPALPAADPAPVELRDFYMRGACGSHPDLDWFSQKPKMQAECKAVCQSCPVREQCRAYGLTTGLNEPGIWGGLTAAERQTLAQPAGSDSAQSDTDDWEVA